MWDNQGENVCSVWGWLLSVCFIKAAVRRPFCEGFTFPPCAHALSKEVLMSNRDTVIPGP